MRKMENTEPGSSRGVLMLFLPKPWELFLYSPNDIEIALQNPIPISYFLTLAHV